MIHLRVRDCTEKRTYLQLPVHMIYPPSVGISLVSLRVGCASHCHSLGLLVLTVRSFLCLLPCSAGHGWMLKAVMLLLSWLSLCCSARRQPPGRAPSVHPRGGKGECSHPHFQGTPGRLYRLPRSVWQVLEYGNYSFSRGMENLLEIKYFICLKTCVALLSKTT